MDLCSKRLSYLFATLLVSASLTAADEPLWGEYVGGGRAVQVAPRPDDEFEIVVYNGGLPGAGWDGKEPQRFLDTADTAEAIIDGMNRVLRVSPTEGAVAPDGALVLFSKPTDAANWQHAPGHENSAEPFVTPEGFLNGGITSKQTFRDFTLHVEFLPPFQPKRLGNYPGNSGIYLQDRYEIQILDDFGQEMRENSCGAVYRLAEPALNVCFPPGRWQTYDINFRSARYDERGEKTANARLTVRQNGVLIHDDVEIAKVTNGNHLPESPAAGPIHLQKHGDPVVFRNVWLLPRDEAALAKRPIVPAYERLAGSAPTAAHGKVLVSELACTACHQANEADSWLYREQGPDLSQLAERVNPGWLATYLSAPHDVKPGTKMPDVMSHLPEAERTSAAEDIAAFLLGDRSSLSPAKPDWFAARQGEQVFNRVGCAACHNPAGAERQLSTSVPFGDLRSKYTKSGLEAFLKNPHAIRTSGRMPSLGLDDSEVQLLAAYLLLPPGMEMPESALTAAFYEIGVSDFNGFDEQLANRDGSDSEGPVQDFSIGGFGKQSNFGVRFEGTFQVPITGTYRFRIGSDDGSRIAIDGQAIVTVDGLHPYQTGEAELELNAGTHAARVDFFQAGGGMEFTCEWMRPGDSSWRGFEEAFVAESSEEAVAIDESALAYAYSEASAARGRERYVSLGCANCHAVGDRARATLTAPALASLNSSAGCLAAETKPGLPNYDLSPSQRSAIKSALAATEPVETISHMTTSLNCIACHQRDGMGGPETARDPYFTTLIKEMGDEGRVPPMLDHVGDKLKTSWLARVLNEGQNVRPYMSTRMPVYRLADAGHRGGAEKLADAFAKADMKTSTPLPELGEGMHRTRTAGRLLVDNGGLACIKCHSFGKYKGLGLQAVNLLDMTPRLREDWIHRYIMNPASLRPGTRMPTGFPNGVSVVTDLYDGEPSAQIAAIWKYLGEGNSAAIPKGMLPDPIELKPVGEPIIYRNFIEGLSPRGIAVGYPERVNLAFDADKLALTLLWQNEFIDAAKHWRGRGPGFQRPLGDNVLTYQRSPVVAPLATPDATWPTEQDLHFGGYRLNEKKQPTFTYTVDGIVTYDAIQPIETESSRGIRRRLETATIGAGQTTFRLGVSPEIDVNDGVFRFSNGIRIRVREGEPVVRSINGQQELRVQSTSTEYDLLW